MFALKEFVLSQKVNLYSKLDYSLKLSLYKEPTMMNGKGKSFFF